MTDEEWIEKNPYVIKMARYHEVNTDPQRRCYNGCHAKSEIIRTPWDVLNRLPTLEQAQDALQFWRKLNDYAVSQRGASAKTDYQLEFNGEVL